MNREEKRNISNENQQDPNRVEASQSSRDISQIDRHEGDMNNGELGGNFNNDNEKENDE